ncbi:MAG: hypothetical protein Q4E69_01115 [Bacilli bacterium]|nr:hypothetical protein [Bacilli bacterium]
MDIDLRKLYTHVEKEIDITGKYDIPNDYYEFSDILELKNIEVSGKITLALQEDLEESEYIKCNIKGIVVVEDSITLEPVDYEISIEYDDFVDENCKKSENTLDIFEFLWENIVLEVPLQFTKVKDLNQFKGDGWKLVSEDELTNTNNPFKDLLKNQEKE